MKGKQVKYTKQENRICSFYVTDRLLEILELEDTNKKKLLKLLKGRWLTLTKKRGDKVKPQIFLIVEKY